MVITVTTRMIAIANMYCVHIIQARYCLIVIFTTTVRNRQQYPYFTVEGTERQVTSERLSNLPKVTQLVSCRKRIQIQCIALSLLCNPTIITSVAQIGLSEKKALSPDHTGTQ